MGIIIFCLAIPLNSNTVNAFHYTRLTVIIFVTCGILTIGNINIDFEGLSIFSGQQYQSEITLFIEQLLFTVGCLCIITFNTKGVRDSKRDATETGYVRGNNDSTPNFSGV